MRQGLRAARVATSVEAVQREILRELAGLIPGMDLSRSPAALSQAIYEATYAHTGIADPYAELKREENRVALAFEEELREMVRVSDDPLRTGLCIAASGNVVDLGILNVEEIDIREAVASALREGFAVDHTEAFREALGRCEDLLYLLDNAGEIVFDKILIEELSRHTTVTAVVKKSPIINDVCYEDARQVGLDAVCEVIDNGGAFIGAPLEWVPEWFMERMKQADIILGKGQGNYETVDDFPGDVYLIFRSKCPVVAAHSGAPLGSVAMISTRLRG